jgi:hypothetical protein
MICQTCSSITGFDYRGRVLCAICIDKMVTAEFERNQSALINRPPPKPIKVDCEICGKRGEYTVGISSLCKKCASEAESCDHQNYEVIENLIDNYIVTVHICRKCGLRFYSE